MTEAKVLTLDTMLAKVVETAQASVPSKNDIMAIISKTYESLEGAIQSYGPAAFDALLWIIWAKALFRLGLAILCTTVSGWAVKIAVRNWHAGCSENEFFKGLGAAIASGAALVVACGNAWFSFTFWLMLFSPKLYLFYLAVSKFINI